MTELIINRKNRSSYRGGDDLYEEASHLMKVTKHYLTKLCDVFEEMEDGDDEYERMRSSRMKDMSSEDDYRRYKRGM